jgi:hypothetical protein
MPLPARSNSTSSNCARSLPSDWLTADCVTNSRLAALVRLWDS